MGWIVGSLIMVIAMVVCFVLARAAKREAEKNVAAGQDASEEKAAALWLKVGGFALAFGLLAFTFASSLYVVQAGSVGVVKTFGSIDGQTGDGPHFIAPWSDLITVSTKVQKREFDHLAAFSKETQDVFVDATLNLAVAPQDVQCLYRTVGSDWFDKLIPQRVLQTLKDETVKYSTVNVAPNRETIRKNVRERLQQQLSNFSVRPGACSVAIDVQDFLLRNIDFRPEFKQAIERKQIATQDAQTAKNRVAQAQYQADQVAATASGAARATLINAKAQASANRLIAASVTPEVIQFAYVQKLAPGVKTIVGPPNVIFGLNSLTGAGK